MLFRSNYLKQPADSTSSVTTWRDLDLDLYAVALPLSLTLVILSVTSLTSGGRLLHAAAKAQVYQGQLAASCFLLAGTILGIVLTWRRRRTCKKDRYVAKKRVITKFLAAMDKHSEQHTANIQQSPSVPTKTISGTDHGLDLSGTSLTDVYPVYRRQEESEAWHKLPALLLVKGDVIAMQVGDICPAQCKRQNGHIIAALERITTATLGCTPISSTSSLPKGKTTVAPDSTHLLTLCNNMFVSTVEESPLNAFLNRPNVTERVPQVHRQLQEIRRVLLVVASVTFLISLALVFVRPGVLTSDLSIVLHAPILAALAVLPFVGPCFLFFLEVLGTSRILVSVHPHAANRGQLDMGKWELLMRYVMATAASRLALQDPGDKLIRCLHRIFVRRKDFNVTALTKLVPVPPGSMCMLEKLGVVTAFALIDDELACEPHSAPQQLIIPSGDGLKLLDISPTYESESSSDSDSERNLTQRRGTSVHESDSDSEIEGARMHQSSTTIHLGALRRRRKREHRRIRGAKVEVDSMNVDTRNSVKLSDNGDVQFEDPSWWQHLPSLKCIGLACLLVDDDANSISIQGKKRKLFPSQDSDESSRIKASLVRHIVTDQVSRRQLKSLAHCIGLRSDDNSNGERGDTTPFTLMQRFEVVTSRLVRDRLEIDSHAVGLEASRRWGLLTPDSTSVIVQDQRSRAYHLLTVGDPTVVISLCQEAWQGENSTILPLSAPDRKRILETSNDWKLGDLDVYAFSYTPLPQTFEQVLQIESKKGAGGHLKVSVRSFCFCHPHVVHCLIHTCCRNI